MIKQAQQLYTVLKRSGKTTRFVRYPGESHGMSRTGQPKHRIERLRHLMDWFDRWLWFRFPFLLILTCYTQDREWVRAERVRSHRC